MVTDQMVLIKKMIVVSLYLYWMNFFNLGCVELTQDSTPSQENDLAQLSETSPELPNTASSKTATLSTQQKRVISLAPSHTEWVFALGAQRSLIGRTDRCDQPPQVVQVPSIGTLFPPQVERIISRSPTDVLMIAGHHALKAQLRRLGIRVHELQPHSLQDIFTQVGKLGAILGHKTDADRWIKQSKVQIDRLKSPKQRLTVFIEIWNAPLTAVGAESFMGDLVRVAGGEVYPKGLGAWPTVSLERLIAHDPDLILLSTQALYDQLMNNPSKPWRALKAVKKKHLYLLKDRLTRPGPRVIHEIVWLNELLTRTAGQRTAE